jgi:hypothetical protein
MNAVKTSQPTANSQLNCSFFDQAAISNCRLMFVTYSDLPSEDLWFLAISAKTHAIQS